MEENNTDPMAGLRAAVEGHVAQPASHPDIPVVINARVVPPMTDASLDVLTGVVDPVETLQRIYDSTPIEAIEFLYGDTPAVRKLKKAWKSLTTLSATDWDDLPLTLNPVQVAMILSVSPEKVRGWITRGELKASDLGNGRSQYVIRKDDLQDFMNSRQPVKVEARKRRRRTTKNPDDLF